MQNYRVIYHDEMYHERKVGGRSKTISASKEYVDEVRSNTRSESEAAKYIASRVFKLDEDDDSWTATISMGQKNPKTGMYPITVTVHNVKK